MNATKLVGIVLISFLAEKNPIKAWSNVAPVVLSNGRLVRFMITLAWISKDDISGPQAWLGAALAFGPELSEALRDAINKIQPNEVLSAIKSLRSSEYAGNSETDDVDQSSHKPNKIISNQEGFEASGS